MAETGRLVGLVVTLVAAVVVIAAVAVPVLSSVTDSVYTTEENTDYAYRMSAVSDTYRITYVDSENIDLNGKNYTIEEFQAAFGTGYVMTTTDTFILRISAASTSIYLYIIGVGDDASISVNTAGGYLEFDGAGTATIYAASTGTTYTESYSWAFVPDEDGDWISTTNGGWVTNGTTIYGRTNAAPTLSTVFAIAEGTSEGMTSTTCVYYDSGLIDTSIDWTVNVSETDELSSYVKSVTGTDEFGNSKSISLIMPLQYRVLTDSQSTLLSLVDVIPLLLVLMTLLVAAYAVIRSAQE